MTAQTIKADDIAVRLGICRPQVYKLLREKVIPSLRTSPNGKYIISLRCYEEWEANVGRNQ